MWKVDWECQEDAGIRDLQRRIEQELVDELRRRLPGARRSCGRARRGFLTATPGPDDRRRPASDRAARRRSAVVRRARRPTGDAVAGGPSPSSPSPRCRRSAGRSSAAACSRPPTRPTTVSAPRASRITVGVESRTLSATLTLAGEISFAEPTPIALAGSVGIAEGETAVVTRPPVLDAVVAEGDVLLEVSGRPVIVLAGRAADVPLDRARRQRQRRRPAGGRAGPARLRPRTRSTSRSTRRPRRRSTRCTRPRVRRAPDRRRPTRSGCSVCAIA